MSIFSRKSNAPAAAETTFDAATQAVEDISGVYAIDPSHSYIGFQARHAMVTTVRGAFKEYQGTATIDAANPGNSKAEITIAVDSLDTASADRDGHLASEDFFDVAKYPNITFTSSKIERDGDDWAVTGDLTIKDVTKPVTVVFEHSGSARDPFGNLRVGFEGEIAVNRKDWNLTWNAALETGGVLVSEKVKLKFDISAIKNA